MAPITTTAIVQRESGGPTSIETIELGELRPEEALVEMHYSGVCHTDLTFMSGQLAFAGTPTIYGHEGAGVVLDVGSEVSSVVKGDKVLLSFWSCETCRQCKAGHPAYCYQFPPVNFSCIRNGGNGPTGYSLRGGGADDRVHGHFFGQSSFSRVALVHRSSVVRVPADTPLEKFAPLGCGMQTGAGAVINVMKPPEGSSFLIFGCGGLGMAAVMAARICKAKTIIAVDLLDDRLRLAEELGATHTINGKDEDIVQQVHKICPPNGVDFAFDATGVIKVIETMIQCTGSGGMMVSSGAPLPGETIKLEVLPWFLAGKKYVGATEGDAVPRDFVPYLIEEHNKGNFPLDKLITYYDFNDYEKAFDHMKAGKTIKPVLKMK